MVASCRDLVDGAWPMVRSIGDRRGDGVTPTGLLPARDGFLPVGGGDPPWGVTLVKLPVFFRLRFYVSARYSFQMSYG